MFMCILLLTSVINDDTNEMIHQCAKAKTFRSQISKMKRLQSSENLGKIQGGPWPLRPALWKECLLADVK